MKPTDSREKNVQIRPKVCRKTKGREPMAGTIRLLSEDVIGKIAAGEVVERPSAAIKEMVENSLDAGATAITVEIRDGGISYFRVTDNGSGIRQNEIRMAFERHATSKITNAQDLFAIQTLGFRGEALASIAAVGRVTCTTRTKDDASGVKVVNCGGRIESIEEAACPEGTTFVVRDLFFNTPVRLKFLKKPVTETGYVSDLMMRLILSRPDVSFRYISNGKTLYHSAGDGKLASAVFSIYGNELLRSMQKVQGHQAGMILSGYVGAGESVRATRAHQSFFINGRYMKSALLSAAVEAACRERVPAGKYPTCVLHLTMPYDLVDVNVHPNKLECRFQNETALAEAIEAIIRDAYDGQNPLDKPDVMQIVPPQPAKPAVAVRQQATVQQPVKVETPARTEHVKPPEQMSAPGKPGTVQVKAVPRKAVQPPAPESKEPEAEVAKQPRPQVVPVRTAPRTLQPLQPTGALKSAASQTLQQTPSAMVSLMRSYQETPPPPIAKPVQAPVQRDQTVSTDEQMIEQSFLPEAPKPLRLIGTVFDSYILVEYEDNLLLVDQQGVHERLLFDRMMKALDTAACAQELLVPMIIPATRREQLLLDAHRDMLESIGLVVESFGETEVSVRAIPMILGQPQTADLLREIIGQLESERGVISLEKRRAGILALACKKAVRKGEKLTGEDIRELVVRRVEKKITPASPRGNPLIIALPHADLDRRFRRLQ